MSGSQSRTSGAPPSATQTVAGTVTADQGSPGGQAWPVSGPLTDAQLRASAVPVSAASLPLPAGAATEATLARLPPAASASGVTNVVSSATNATLLAANANRLGAAVFNDSTQILYLKLGATASATSYTVQVAAGGYYEVPFRYTGIIDGLWASANGNARVTELTA